MAGEKVWHLFIGGKQEGPFSLEEVQAKLTSGAVNQESLAFGPGMSQWAAIKTLPALAGGGAPAAAPPPPAGAAAGISSDVIDHEIFGNEMQFVEIELDPGETVIAEAGAMMHMDAAIKMETRMGDGSEPNQGFMSKVWGAAKRKLTGESLFMTWFSNAGQGKQKVAFGAPYPGKIIPWDLKQIGGTVICQKDAFLCAAKGTKLGIAINKRIGAGFFGGEGFIMQKVEGDGMAFAHAGGTIVQKQLQAGQTLKIDTGCIVAFTQGVNYDIQMVKGIGSILFGGEGLFFATLTGPGTIWLQSLPFSRLADRIYGAMPQHSGGRSVGEGSVLGGIGDLLGGD